MTAGKAALPPPPKCDDCDEHRQVTRLDGRVGRCPRCHPLSPRSLTTLIEERARLQRQLKAVDDAIAAAEAAAAAPSWARGPAVPR